MVFIPYPVGTEPEQLLSGLPEEMAFNRDLTEWFIEQDPVTVALVPRVQTRTATGAYRTADGPARASQRFKFVYGGNTGAGRAGVVEAGDGRERMFSFVMIGKFDAVIGVGDHWLDIKSQHWEVEELLPDNGYERKATVRSYGGDPQYG